MTEKRCTGCKHIKAASEFGQHATRPTGLSDCCWECKRLAVAARRYGISAEEYIRLHELQDGRCAICRQPERAKWRGRVKNLAVDHDHETDAVRALLCHACNVMIGLAGESPAILEAGAAYLEMHRAAAEVCS